MAHVHPFRYFSAMSHCLITNRPPVQRTEERTKWSVSIRSAVLAPCPGPSRLRRKRALPSFYLVDEDVLRGVIVARIRYHPRT